MWHKLRDRMPPKGIKVLLCVDVTHAGETWREQTVGIYWGFSGGRSIAWEAKSFDNGRVIFATTITHWRELDWPGAGR